MFAPESLTTPRKAQEAAAIISAACFNDEIRAHVAAELLKRILWPANSEIARSCGTAVFAATALTVAFDRHYRD